MSWLTGRKIREGTELLLRNGSAVIARGVVTDMHTKNLCEVLIVWSCVGVYVTGSRYQVDLRPGMWTAV